MIDSATLIRDLIAAGVSPTDAAKAAADALRDDAPTTPAKRATDTYRTAVISAAEGFTNAKGERVNLMVPGTIRITDGDAEKGTVIGRDAKRPNEASVRVGRYRRNKAGEYRVRSDAFTEGELHEFLAHHATVFSGKSAPAKAAKARPAKADGFDPSTASLAELRAHAEATGQKFDGRWSLSTARERVTG